MGEVTEKIYCCDRSDNDNALAAAILANSNRHDDSWPMAAAPVANQAAFLATFKEKLCRCICATSTNQPFAAVTYRNETPVLNGTTVFVPTVATTTITTPNACKCQAETQVINERFVVAFQGRTMFPTSVTINQLGMTQGLIKIVCGKSNCYAINSSLSVSIPAEPAV